MPRRDRHLSIEKARGAGPGRTKSGAEPSRGRIAQRRGPTDRCKTWAIRCGLRDY